MRKEEGESTLTNNNQLKVPSMNFYHVSKESKNNGEHEIHKSTCSFLPVSEKRIFLGFLSSCNEAIAEAKKHFEEVNPCYYCCFEYHSETND